MTAVEIKTAIKEVLNEVPEDVLPQILSYLKAIRSETKESDQLKNNLDRVLEEDAELLRRLAE